MMDLLLKKFLDFQCPMNNTFMMELWFYKKLVTQMLLDFLVLQNLPRK